MTSKHIFASLLSSAFVIGACTAPETQTAPITEIEIVPPTTLTASLQGALDSSPDRQKTNYMRSFDRLAQNDEVRSDQIKSLLTQKHAELRGYMIGAILSGDIDNNGELNASELLSLAMNRRSLNAYGRGQSIPFTQGDRNEDGIFSAEEIRRFAGLFADMDTIINNDPTLSLMAFDSDKDGVLTRTEITRELDVVIETTSKKLPIDTLPAPKGSERHKAQQKLRDEVCQSKLNVPKDAEIILLSGYEGTAMSTVTVTTGHHETEVTQIIIEPGQRPLHIIAGTFTDMIWSLEGDTDRVSGFVARKSRVPSDAGAGVIGLPAKKVNFIASSCFKYFKTEKSQGGILAKSLFERIYERPVDHVVASYKLDSVSLPSGVMQGKARRKMRQENEKETKANRTQIAKGIALSARNNFDAGRKTSLFRFSEDGVAYIDPKAVVAPTLVKTYEVYPAHAGLAQLIETGHLELIERETYYIHKTFPYFPAGLGGATSVKFILGKNVQRPSGQPGHSSLLDEATGECLTRRCR